MENPQYDPSNYKWGIFYYNGEDPRVFVPKNFGIGYTLNFANPNSYLVIGGIIIFAIVMGWIGKRA